ncbi:MAG: SDR family oxidoreductase [Planctomycetes bacterium]|jgi:NAD(P)-dependent dehydrogenase (short-subunit alcohol dehydrogenase family)|nr:SDR family oxidoreductase [Planctomycetota bacterium]MCP4838957.1 SDR family oxidoreductase [Planctomycetota bacterium]
MSTSPVAIITAASKGIGAACARKLAEDGYRVALMSRSEAGRAVAEEIDGAWLQGDLTNDSDIAALVDTARERWNRLDAAIINTGHLATGPLLELDDDAWRAGLDMVLLSVMRVAKRAVPLMRESGGGAIVCTSGAAARDVMDDYPISTVLRSGLTAMVRLASRQWAPDIRVNAVMPGFVETFDVPVEIIEQIPAGRAAEPAELAGLMAWLCSDAARYVTGESICMDGGLTRAVR